MRKVVGVVAACVVGVSGSACATKGFVRDSVADVNKKVESVSQSLEATQEQTRENTARIQQVDQRRWRRTTPAMDEHRTGGL